MIVTSDSLSQLCTLQTLSPLVNKYIMENSLFTRLIGNNNINQCYHNIVDMVMISYCTYMCKKYVLP